MSTGTITAKKLMERLNSDPEFLKKKAQRDAELEERQAHLNSAQAPLLAELRTVGLELRSVWDLVNTSRPYPEAIPILLKHLTRDYPQRIREGIARALAVKDASFAWHTLKTIYLGTSEKEVKDGLAVALAASSNESLVGDLAELAKDKEQGNSRLLLLRGLRRSRSLVAKNVLAELAHDPELAKEIASWKRKQ